MCPKFPSLLILMFLGFICCNPEDKQKNILIKHELSDFTSLNPVYSQGASEQYCLDLIFERMVTIDYETFGYRLQLASAIPEYSDDFLSFTCTLDPKAKFPDGQPVTSSDVLFSYKAIMNPDVDAQHQRGNIPYLKDAEIIDAHTIRFFCTKAAWNNHVKLCGTLLVMPKHIFDPTGISDAYTSLDCWKALQNPPLIIPEQKRSEMKKFADHFHQEKFSRSPENIIGSGRYKLSEWVTGQYIKIIRNEKYWRKNYGHAFDQQGPDAIIYKVINDMESALIALKSGDIDLTDALQPSQILNKLSSPSAKEKFDLKVIDYPYFYYIGWNSEVKGQPFKTFFSDKTVREAMSHLIDTKMIIKKVMYGMAHPTHSMIFYKRPEYNNELEDIPYDMEKAKSMLEKAGWRDSDGDGVRDKMIHGRKVPFEFTFSYNHGNDIRKNIGLIVQENMRNAGIKVNIMSYEWGVFIEKLKNHELEAWIGAWVYDSDEQDLYSLFHSNEANRGYNYGNYKNPEVDKLLFRIPTTFNTEERMKLHKLVQKYLYDDQPYAMLFMSPGRIVYNRRLRTDRFYEQRPCFDPGQFTLSGMKSGKN